MDNDKKDNDAIRLQVFLARCGLGSRRKCEEFIEAGRVTVNGKHVILPGTKVTPEVDAVTFDSREVKPMKKKLYFALHKPSGYICSNSSQDQRPLAISLFPTRYRQHLFQVGRLDYMTSGLIFFTNDGDFSSYLTHPSSKMEKEYEITTKKSIPEELLEDFKAGIRISGVMYKLKRYTRLSERRVRIVLTEGKNRELRKVFMSRNVSLKKIHRIRIGQIRLKGIQPGHFRSLKEEEINSLREGNK